MSPRAKQRLFDLVLLVTVANALVYVLAAFATYLIVS